MQLYCGVQQLNYVEDIGFLTVTEEKIATKALKRLNFLSNYNFAIAILSILWYNYTVNTT